MSSVTAAPVKQLSRQDSSDPSLTEAERRQVRIRRASQKMSELLHMDESELNQLKQQMHDEGEQ